MGLEPLEFSECLTDSPYFREKLHAHERELKKTNKVIKVLIVQSKELLQAAASKYIRGITLSCILSGNTRFTMIKYANTQRSVLTQCKLLNLRCGHIFSLIIYTLILHQQVHIN
jgi:hypothetical protein